MARYREKDQVDLAWNKVRRRITREFDTELMDAREDALNKLLADAWEKFNAKVGDGQVLEVDAKFAALTTAIVNDVIPKNLVIEHAVVEPDEAS